MNLMEKLDPKTLAKAGGGIAKTVASHAVEHGPEMLAATAVVGLVTTVVLAAKATPKALELRGKRPVKVDGDGNADETAVEQVLADAKAMAPAYIPAAITGAATVACIVGGNRMQAKRYATLAAAYSLSEKVAMQYQQKVIEEVGQEAHDKIMEKVVQETPEAQDCPFDGYIVGGNGDVLVYDSVTGMVFKSTKEKIAAAEGQISKKVLAEGYASICDLYSELGVRYDNWEDGDSQGWTLDGESINIRMGDATMEPDGRIPKMTIWYPKQRLRY